jgi:aromatic ring-opening dioxygenase catalytic subunit (LigB family)
MSRLPTYYVSHGGGPWPWMREQSGARYAQLEASLQAMAREAGDGVRAVLVVTAHWETPEFTLSSAEQPGMLYDYHGFPPHTYQIHYRAPGSPTLAARVQALLQAGGVAARLDPERGFDHGTFSVMQATYPAAQLPVVQLSLRADFDPAAHLAAGRLLAPLRDEGVLIIGSGLSYHNLRLLNANGTAPSVQFDDWLQTTLTTAPPAERDERLLHWEQAPSARIAHAREDHLIPLMVAVGAAHEETGHCVYHEDRFMGVVAASSFRFGNAPNAQG